MHSKIRNAESTCFSMVTGSILKPLQLSVHGLWIDISINAVLKPFILWKIALWSISILISSYIMVVNLLGKDFDKVCLNNFVKVEHFLVWNLREKSNFVCKSMEKSGNLRPDSHPKKLKKTINKIKNRPIRPWTTLLWPNHVQIWVWSDVDNRINHWKLSKVEFWPKNPI